MQLSALRQAPASGKARRIITAKDRILCTGDIVGDSDQLQCALCALVIGSEGKDDFCDSAAIELIAPGCTPGDQCAKIIGSERIPEVGERWVEGHLQALCISLRLLKRDAGRQRIPEQLVEMMHGQLKVGSEF